MYTHTPHRVHTVDVQLLIFTMYFLVPCTAVPTALTIQEMTRKAGITEADLQERVAQPNLYQIANSIGDDWKGLVLPLRLSEQADEASQALTKWRTDRGHEANYLSLVEAFLGLKKIRHAERVFELLKGQFCLPHYYRTSKSVQTFTEPQNT